MVTYVYIIYIYWSVVSVDVGIIIRPTCVVNVPNTSRASLFLFFVGKAGKPTWLHPEDLRFEALKKKKKKKKKKKERKKQRKKKKKKKKKKKNKNNNNNNNNNKSERDSASQ